ncbi:MAG: ribosome maturation factor RimM [Cyanobacteria bacterium REEB459]|nr:ribosome maturation factor RimM [Cyanobacteria bacterium REEB459]
MSASHWLEIGRIVAPQGLQGEVRVAPSSDFPERFLEPGQRWLRRPHCSTPEPIQLLQGRLLEGRQIYILRLQGIGDRDQAEALRGCTLLVSDQDRPTLAADEFYVADLIGLRVLLQSSGAEIGAVTDLYTAGNDLLEVRLHGFPGQTARQVLIPFVPAIVPQVNLQQGYLTIDPPMGLLGEADIGEPENP